MAEFTLAGDRGGTPQVSRATHHLDSPRQGSLLSSPASRGLFPWCVDQSGMRALKSCLHGFMVNPFHSSARPARLVRSALSAQRAVSAAPAAQSASMRAGAAGARPRLVIGTYLVFVLQNGGLQ